MRSFDTPGFVSRTQLLPRLDVDELKAVLHGKRVRPCVQAVTPGRAICLGGLARLVLEEAHGTVLAAAFVNHEVSVHVTSAERAAELQRTFSPHNVLVPPFSQVRTRRASLRWRVVRACACG